jgi:hypothetical protein
MGLLGLLATYLIRYIPIPSIYLYKTPIQITSILVISIGVFICGANWNNNSWLEKVRELEEKVVKAQEAAQVVNTQIETKIVKEKAKIVEKQIVVKEYIDREVVKYDNQCVVPKEFVDAHNQATKHEK